MANRRTPRALPLAALSKEIATCTCCTAFSSFGYWKFPPIVHGNPTSGGWIVGTDPRRIDVELQAGRSPRYWKGASRRNLREPLERHFGVAPEALLTRAVFA